MKGDWTADNKVIKVILDIINCNSQLLNMDMLSVVLYGARAKKGFNSQDAYDILILFGDQTSLNSYIKFTEMVKLQLIREKLYNVKFIYNTPETFEDLLYNDNITGTFLYMICKENLVLADKNSTFAEIKERITHNMIKDEEIFLKQCIEFCRVFGSEKWERKWEKTLQQYLYNRNRRQA